MASDIHGKAVKGCDGIPIALRDELRALRGLPNFVPKAEPEKSKNAPEDMKRYIDKQEMETVHKKQCKSWYANALPFTLASDVHHREYIETLKRMPAEVLAQYRPLDRHQVSEVQRINECQNDVLLLENALVERSGGGFCGSTDGGKVGYAATRVVMADCSHGVFWIACYCTGDAKKDAEYLSSTLIQKLRDCEKRGWKCRGMVTDNAAAELAAMALLKVLFEKEFKRALVILRCILHTGALAQGDVLPWPSVRKDWEKKHPDEEATWKPFQEWWVALDLADEISRVVKNRAKLRDCLQKVITLVERVAEEFSSGPVSF